MYANWANGIDSSVDNCFSLSGGRNLSIRGACHQLPSEKNYLWLVLVARGEMTTTIVDTNKFPTCPVVGIVRGFRTHGYCMGPVQGNERGSFVIFASYSWSAVRVVDMVDNNYDVAGCSWIAIVVLQWRIYCCATGQLISYLSHRSISLIFRVCFRNSRNSVSLIFRNQVHIHKDVNVMKRGLWRVYVESQ